MAEDDVFKYARCTGILSAAVSSISIELAYSSSVEKDELIRRIKEDLLYAVQSCQSEGVNQFSEMTIQRLEMK